MSGTRKLEKFELGRPANFESGTRKLERFAGPNVLSIQTPIAEISPAMLAAARPSMASLLPPLPEPSIVIAADPEPVPDPAAAVEPGASHARPSRASRAVDRDPDADKLRTRLARRFTTLADEVTESFADFRIGAGSWTVELTAPDGMSTAGGKRVLQHLRLRPTRQGHAVLVGGMVNAVARTAELRDHGHMETIYQARFGQRLEISAAEWEQFLRKAEVVLRNQRIRTARVPAPRDLLALASSSQHAPWWNRNLVMTGLVLVSFLASIVVWRVLAVLWP